MAEGAVEVRDRLHGSALRPVGGDVIVRRSDGLYAYQLAVVVDDAADGVTDVVRGDDLLGSTARQVALQQLLWLAQPAYAHVPLMLGMTASGWPNGTAWWPSPTCAPLGPPPARWWARWRGRPVSATARPPRRPR